MGGVRRDGRGFFCFECRIFAEKRSQGRKSVKPRMREAGGCSFHLVFTPDLCEEQEPDSVTVHSFRQLRSSRETE